MNSWQCAWLASVLLTASAWAQDPAPGYPGRPIRVIVPFPAGGAADALPRIVGERLGLGNSALLVEDVPADPGKRPLASRPVGFDVRGVKEQGALQHWRLPPVVDRFSHFPGAQPVLARRWRH